MSKRNPQEGEQGTIVGREMCPQCEAQPVAYNGNYFCDGLGYTCDWASAALEPGESPDPYLVRLIMTYCEQEGIEVNPAWVT